MLEPDKMFMCLTDFQEELGENAKGVRLYESMDALLGSGRKCLAECGIAEVRLNDNVQASNVEFDACENVVYPRERATISAIPVAVELLRILRLTDGQWTESHN